MVSDPMFTGGHLAPVGCRSRRRLNQTTDTSVVNSTASKLRHSKDEFGLVWPLSFGESVVVAEGSQIFETSFSLCSSHSCSNRARRSIGQSRSLAIDENLQTSSTSNAQVSLDEGDHRFNGQSNSAIANYADYLRRSSLPGESRGSPLESLHLLSDIAR
ncbi:hypothetical protein C770_GR4pB175 (plasmid) [Sinorhizobium meliloti GR4]|nr:hypothetical protein C770_GR4pB175 [Sinorhizobium meliloti GR4]